MSRRSGTFESTSGSSVRGRTRTSRKANAGLKSLLHMAALVAIRNDAELGTYYKRKVAEESPSCVRSTLSVARSSIASVPSCAMIICTRKDPCFCHRITPVGRKPVILFEPRTRVDGRHR
ncbi:MAG: transposase [Flavobacteriales bacterium]|nr:transposase [Flavobacteriales bacterium]